MTSPNQVPAAHAGRAPRFQCGRPWSGIAEFFRSVDMGDLHDLKELLRSIIADGEFGVTLRSDEPPIVHTPNGPLAVPGTKPNRDEIEAFVRQLIGSRGAREFREQGLTRFMLPLEHGVRVIGAARRESHGIHVEIRRMAGSGSNKLY